MKQTTKSPWPMEMSSSCQMLQRGGMSHSGQNTGHWTNSKTGSSLSWEHPASCLSLWNRAELQTTTSNVKHKSSHQEYGQDRNNFRLSCHTSHLSQKCLLSRRTLNHWLWLDTRAQCNGQQWAVSDQDISGQIKTSRASDSRHTDDAN